MYRKQIFQKVASSLPSTPISKEIASSPSYRLLSSVVQRVQEDPNSVSGDERQELENAIGTRSTQEILAGKQTPWVPEFQGISAQMWGDAGQADAPVQAKLTIGEVGDKYEQEADRVAKDVVQQINTPQTNAMPKGDSAQIQTNTLQRQQTDEEELQLKQLPEMVQRREAIAGGEASTDLADSINNARSGGQALDTSLQQSMGQAMGTDFSGVRVHTDAQADQLNQSIQAKAFTTGKDIFFKQGEYNPSSTGGQELLAHELTHVMQQRDKAINRCCGNLVQRMKQIGQRGFLGDLVELDDNEELPKDDGFKYTEQEPSSEGKKIYLRQKLAQKTKINAEEVAKAKKASKRKELEKPKPELFSEEHGGAKEGTFEYVANYLYTEVYKADSQIAQQIWSEVWKVTDDGNSQEAKLERQNIPDQNNLLTRMIKTGLDTSWEKLSIKDIMQLEVKNQKPASSMATLQINPDMWDYLADCWNWKPWSQSKTLGVGFHTTDGQPSTVIKSKDQGGWGGINRPMTAPFFQRRYALNASWNPLETWLNQKGPAFRKGIKDNELLSTVSIATSLHACVKFPLANKNRTHIEENNSDGQKSFKMTAYIYAVTVKEAYATFAKQDNPFPEIATGDVPIQDIIGYAKITRWHDYHKNTENPDDSLFYYEVDSLVENDLGPSNEKLTDKAKEVVNQEQERAKKGKYTPAEN